ncbi:MAG: nucleotidyltransferase family protein [Oscillospiraceae bacterium]|nr:nucleotidyltransferase family protein [Oscillospiraceae bacterium]
MRAVGITAEYNPFHFGHLYQLSRIRERFGADVPVVAVMSGDFVQRGEAAVFSKFARAEAAVRCGVSLVLELPLPWSLSSAEGFARGGIGVLQSVGAVDAFCFGSESGDGEGIRACAAALDTPEFSTALRRALAEGVSFAAARERALISLGLDGPEILRSPNDILGVEYIRAAKRLAFDAAFVPIPRDGTVHDGAGSASDLRRRMGESSDWLERIPPEAAAVFAREIREGRGPVLPEDLRLPLLSRLRDRDRKDFAALPDAGEGLENLLFEASRRESSPEAIAAAAKSKRYALSRLRRMVTCAALGVRDGMADGIPPYLRVLALDDRGAEVLRRMRENASLPVITKPAHIRKEDEDANAVFDLGSRAHDLYVLGFRDPTQQTGGGDMRAAPFIYTREELTT